jgi:hypothetical protein
VAPAVPARPDRFEAPARGRWTQPALDNGGAYGERYQPVTGELFVDGPSAEDVLQGTLGDCYVLSAFAAVAQQHPELIREAFHDNADGSYTVRLFQAQLGGLFLSPVSLKVTADLPTLGNGLAYARSLDRAELWAPLLEKAYAQLRGGYDRVGRGGNPGHVMTALTGRKSSFSWLSPRSPADEVFQKLASCLAQGKCAVAGTWAADKVDFNQTGLLQNHAYTITGVSEEDGTRFVHLRNPWGNFEPAGNGEDDGRFALPLETFLTYFNGLSLC